jgi:hypothetical protein
MALIDFQTALGRLVRTPDGGDPLRGLCLDERDQASLAAVTGSAGFRVTVAIQRSWCEGRAAKAAHLTLSLLNEEHRRRLLAEWTNSGAGTSSFFDAEGDAFLEFLCSRLDDPSQALTICRIERATIRASQRAESFVRPDWSRLGEAEWVVRSDRFAAVIHCDTWPHLLLFGPGLENLWRAASREEADLWARLPAPVMVRELLQTTGCDRQSLGALMDAGAVEFAKMP